MTDGPVVALFVKNIHVNSIYNLNCKIAYKFWHGQLLQLCFSFPNV